MRTLLTALPRRVRLPVLVALAVVAVALGALLTGRRCGQPEPDAEPDAEPCAVVVRRLAAAGDHLGLVVVINRS